MMGGNRMGIDSYINQNRFAWIAILCVIFSLALPIHAGEDAAVPGSEPPAQGQKDLDFADGLYQRGMYETAAKQYDAFVQHYPNHPMRETALFRRGESLYQYANNAGKSDAVKSKIILTEARKVFQSLIQDFPNGEKVHDAYLRHGEISYKIGDAEGGLVSLSHVVKEEKDPSLLEAALFYSARCYETIGNREEAEKRYRQVRDTYPKGEYAAFSSYLLAELLLKADKTQEAIPLLSDLWQHPEKYSLQKTASLVEEAQLRSAQALYQLNRFAEASKAYQAYSATHPEGPNAAKAKYGAAWAEYQQKNYAQALAIANTLQRQTLPPDLAAGILFLQGTCAYQQKQYKEAIRFFREGIANPNAGEYRERSWYQLAWSYYLTDQFEQARQECKNLLQQSISPSQSANAHFLLGQTLAQLKQYPDAIAEMRLVVGMKTPGDYASEALFLLADLFYRTEQYGEAGDAFEKYIATYPNTLRAKEALSWDANARYAARDYKKAVQTADKLMQKYPDLENRSEILYRKALAHYQLKDYEPALKTFAEVLRVSSGDAKKPDALYWTAYILELQGDRRGAGEKYGQLLDRYPQFENRDEVRLRKAVCDYQEKNYPEAYQSFRALLETEQGKKLSPEVIFWTIFYADENKKHEEALKIAERVFTIFDTPSIRERALIAKGNQLAVLQQWKEAVDNADLFLKSFSDSKFKPEIFWSRAKGLEGLQKPEEALRYFDQSLQELQKLGNPDAAFEAELYVDRGRLLLALGKTGEALESFLRVAIIYDHPSLTPEAMFHSIRCHLALGEKKEANMMYNELTQRYPKSSWCEKAKQEYKDLEP